MSPLPFSFDSVLNFTDLLHKFRAIERVLLMNNNDRNENDVEHSFSVALLGWYINDTQHLGLNVEKILKYALIHDLVEVHAGDTFFYQKDSKAIADKKHREEKAAKQLQKEFPEFPELHNLIAAYEKREDKESKFIYALDKVEPILSIYLDGGRTWRRDKVTLDMIKTTKKSKVEVDPTINALFDETVSRLTQKEEELFG